VSKIKARNLFADFESSDEESGKKSLWNQPTVPYSDSDNEGATQATQVLSPIIKDTPNLSTEDTSILPTQVLSREDDETDPTQVL